MRKLTPNKGFTLVELLVVIVIISILVSLVVLNTGAIPFKKALQAREFLILDLQRIKKESLDQSRVLALVTEPSANSGALSYAVYEYHDQSQQQIAQANQMWQRYGAFSARELPSKVSFVIESNETTPAVNASNQDLNAVNAPKLLWLGNGEVRPVRIQFYFEQSPVGDPVEVDYLGNVNADN